MEINKGKDYNFAFTVGGITILAALIVIFVIIRPLYNKNVELRNSKLSRDKVLESVTNREKVLLSLKDKSAEIKQNGSRVSNALPSDSEVGRLFIQLDELAKVSGGNLKSVVKASNSIQSNGSYTNISESQFTLPLEMPSYFAFKKYLESSEEALRLMTIDRLKIDSSESGQLTVSLDVKTYTRSK